MNNSKKQVARFYSQIRITTLLLVLFFLISVLLNYFLSQGMTATSIDKEYEKGENRSKTFKKLDSKEWINCYSGNNLDIYYKNILCNDTVNAVNKEEIVFLFKNKSENKIEVSWEVELNYGGRCINCNSENNELKFKLNIEPRDFKIGNCNDDGLSGLAFFYKFVDQNLPNLKMDDFNLKNINILIK
ncbi:MAG: hypothetical protein HYU67_02700 [Flavobacteriia bacterium]|nr:hypothetical protein [Flavobacteriia bacterium]